MNLYKLPDSLAHPANAILSSMEKMNALADVANTKAAAAAGSPMPPPPPTPGTSGKKRKRSAAAAARDKLVTGKKYQTYKLYEKLQSSKILDDPSELGKLKKYLLDMAILERDGYREYTKETVEKQAKLEEAMQDLTEVRERQRKNYEEATERAKANDQVRFIQFLKWQSAFDSIKSELMEEKLGVMEDREELRKKKKSKSSFSRSTIGCTQR